MKSRRIFFVSFVLFVAKYNGSFLSHEKHERHEKGETILGAVAEVAR